MGLFFSGPVEINAVQWSFLRLRSLLTSLVIYGGQLLGLRSTKHDINVDVTKLSVPLNMDHTSLIDEPVSTD